MRSEAVVSKANYDLLSDAVVRPTSSQEFTDAVDQGIEVVLANLIICDDGQPGAGSRAACEAHIFSLIP